MIMLSGMRRGVSGQEPFAVLYGDLDKAFGIINQNIF